MPLVYVLFSKMVNHYYVGYTTDTIESRIEKHLIRFYKNKFTAQAKDWQLQLEIKCETASQAMQIEKHIKKMKSRKYISDLIKYPEMIITLLNRYN